MCSMCINATVMWQQTIGDADPLEAVLNNITQYCTPKCQIWKWMVKELDLYSKYIFRL